MTPYTMHEIVYSTHKPFIYIHPITVLEELPHNVIIAKSHDGVKFRGSKGDYYTTEGDAIKVVSSHIRGSISDAYKHISEMRRQIRDYTITLSELALKEEGFKNHPPLGQLFRRYLFDIEAEPLTSLDMSDTGSDYLHMEVERRMSAANEMVRVSLEEGPDHDDWSYRLHNIDDWNLIKGEQTEFLKILWQKEI